MKKFFLAVVLAIAAITPSASALDLGLGNHLGVNLNAGTNGIGFEFATPLTRFVQVRAGLSIMPGFHFTTDSEVSTEAYGYENYTDIDLRASFKRVQGSLIFNVYPFPHGSFYVAAGAYFGGKDLVKITGHTDDPEFQEGQVEIGDYTIPVHNGTVKGGLKVQSFRPYLGIGWGRPVPNRRVNFGVELGVQFHGTPKVYTDNGEVIDLEYIDSDDDFQKIMDKLKVWPVLKFTISGRIF